MPALKTYDIFISHAWAYNEDYYNIIKRLESQPNFYFRNYSVPTHDPLVDPNTFVGQQKLISMIDAQIRPVNVVIFIGKMYFYHRNWVMKELDLAMKYNKPCLLIRPLDQQRIPDELRNNCRREVGWYADDIVSAIRDISL